jgi:uncharacterized membrane protein
MAILRNDPAEHAWRALALGLASGARSSVGIAALALATPTGSRSGVLGALTGRRGTAAAVVAASGELVVDKLPQTPSRLQPPAFAARVLAGTTAAAGLALRNGASTRIASLAALVGAAGAVAGTVAGAKWRQWAAGHRPDWQAAVAEDAVTVLLAASAVR